MKKLALILSGILALATASIASADEYEDAIKYRKSAFLLIRANFVSMKTMVEGKAPFDANAFAVRAANLDALAKMPWEHFIAGSEKGDTDAKPEVWKKAKGYKSEVDKFEREVAKLAVVAKEGKEAAVKAQFGRTAKTCKSCHDGFKHK